MFKSFEKAFSDFMRNRATDIADKVSQDNQEYADNRTKAIEVHKKIESLLPDDFKDLIDEYVDYEVSNSVIMIDSVYEQVFIDALALMKLAGLLGVNEFCGKTNNYVQTGEGIA